MGLWDKKRVQFLYPSLCSATPGKGGKGYMAALQVALPSADGMSLRCKEESTDGALSHSRAGARAVTPQGAYPGNGTNTYFDILDNDLVLKLWPRER